VKSTKHADLARAGPRGGGGGGGGGAAQLGTMDVVDEAISSDDNPLQGSGKASGGGTTEERLSLLEAQLVELRSSPGGDEHNIMCGHGRSLRADARGPW
jgi:hypothetical protein